MTQGGDVSPPKKSRSGASRASTRGPHGRRTTDDRYERGTRRASGEPLAAAWKPDAENAEESYRRIPPVRKRGILAVYGWRLYAIPILLVITALVVWDTTNTEPTGKTQQVGNTAAAIGGTNEVPTDTPDATEKPVTPIDAKIPTAELPPGRDFTQAGPETFRVVPGTGPKVGQGTQKTYTYSIEIENGITATDVGGGDDAFAGLVDSTLADPRGWTSDPRIAVQRVTDKPLVRISLTTPETTHKLCGRTIPYESSCRLSRDGRVVINLARWVRGALAFNGDMGLYRVYAINHEVGHAFGRGHEGCAQNDGLAPVMMQQSFGVNNNYVAQLNDAVPGTRDPVKADGKVCKTNPYPNPQGKPPGS
ncbi:hypothetical protein ALI144C_34710 [Actinosynnema sp. ALI-1.44]|uniref:DUF3152 domain-containing protein n=1 Tax=Actinosynnema sp. ALI-1.44 TaxID=1933779 RepID=UPI00097C05D5|nr:DUF3152 domain-containing protein [Actinosynnema sp. ALI-1.44]ONI77223.1 hypothetical protein ALI144C_34710 [Actinosynnema sp. ALI-1.44]